MANDTMYQFRYSYEAAVADIFMKVTFGASGAPTLVSGQNKGIVSIVRNSAGKYTITLKSKFNRLLKAQQVILNATAPAAPGMYVVSDGSATSTPTVVVQFTIADGTATDPGSGETALIQLSLKNSSV